MKPTVISETPGREPLTLEEVGACLRAPDDGNSPPTYVEAAFITRLIVASRKVCEKVLTMSLVPKVLEVTSPNFFERGHWKRGAIQLEGGPVRSIVSVKYIDAAGVDQTIDPANYRIRKDPHGGPDTVVPAYLVSWPTGYRNDEGSVRVRYTAGYPSTDSPPENVPEPIGVAMNLLIGHMFVNREAVYTDNIITELPLGVQYWLNLYRNNLGV